MGFGCRVLRRRYGRASSPAGGVVPGRFQTMRGRARIGQSVLVVPEWLKRKSAEQHHAARGWRFMWHNAIAMGAIGIGLIFLELNVLAAIIVGGAVGCAFIAGYSYRQWVLHLGEKPTWGFLVLRDDPLLDEPRDASPDADEVASSAGRAALRKRLVILHSIGVATGLVLGVVLGSVVVAAAIVGFSVFNLALAAALLRA